MKTLLNLFTVFFILTGPAFAISSAHVVELRDTSGTKISAYTLTSGAAVNTAAVPVEGNLGFATLVITENQGGGTGDVDIYAEYSYDGTNFSRAYVSDMAGTTTIEGNIVTALGNVTNRWIVFTARMAPYMRIVFDPDANSTITARLIFNRDR